METLKKINDIKFRKRDGRIENFQRPKMFKFLTSLQISELEANELIDSVYEVAPEYMYTDQVIGMLERVASRKISMLFPNWENVAAKLYFAKIRQEKFNNGYPKLDALYNIKINQNVLQKFANHLDELDAYIKPERDNKFNYKAAVIFHKKYCKDFEMPQITYMRVAMFLMQNETDFIAKTKQLYDHLSQHYYTLATPIMVNAMTMKPQMSSCCLMTTADSTYSLLETNKNIGVYSANLAGIACDVSALRARGDAIDNGKTSGPVPFLKMFEATISAWNQGGTRPGALAIYFPWWHENVFDLLSLKSNGGVDENRARRLQYGIKLNDYFIRAVKLDEEIALVSPLKARELEQVYGSEFNQKYEKFLHDPTVKKVRARELWFKIFKERAETGNIYLYHDENVNQVSMLNRYIGSSNLCTEIVLPSRPAKFETEQFVE